MGFSPAQETRRNYHPLTKQEHLHTPLLISRNAEPLWSLSVSLLQSHSLHRVSPHLFRLNSHLQLPGEGFLEGQWWAQQVGRDVCFPAGQSVRCGQDTNHCHFIIYRHVCIVSGAQLLSGIQFLAILWTVAHQAPLSMEFSRQNTGVGCYFLLQGIFLTQGLNPHLLNWQADSELLLSYWGNPIYRHNYLNAEFNSYSSFMVLADVLTIIT